MSDEDRERKNIYIREIITIKKRNLLNHLIHDVEELENVNLNK